MPNNVDATQPPSNAPATPIRMVTMTPCFALLPNSHFWLYPRPASHPLRGTEFLNAPQHSQPADARKVSRSVRDYLVGSS